ncbi:MAG: hypothetical protein GX556_15635 [Fibrobacter sp.]|nr:hypothetical protein [Fibrobacter sp.]
MRTLLSAILFVLFVVSGLNAEAPAYSATDASYQYGGVDIAISTSTKFDSLRGATDSMTLLSGKAFDVQSGWQYILVRDAFSGSDSVAIQVNLDALDKDGNLLYRTAIDSFKQAAGEAVLLPLLGTVFGHKYRIKLHTYAGNGGKEAVYLNRFYIYKRRPVTMIQQWK